MSNKNQFMISVKSPLVESKVSSLMGTTELHDGAEGTSHEINNYFDEIVAKKNGQGFTFTWNPGDKYKSTFGSIKSKKKPEKTFQLVLMGKLLDDGKLIWSRRLDIKNAWVKDAQPDARMGGQLVIINYESAKPSDAVHH
jgi:hypothetical protein